LAAVHQLVGERRHQTRLEPRVRQYRAQWSSIATSHDGAPCPRLSAPGAVLGTTALAVLHTLRVERAADDVVTHARQVLHTTTANEHHRVLLQRVTFARDVCGDFDLIGETDASDFAECGVRLLRGDGTHLGADATLLRRALR